MLQLKLKRIYYYFSQKTPSWILTEDDRKEVKSREKIS